MNVPLTTLDSKTALVVIDLQNGLRGLAGAPYAVRDIIDRAAGLAKAFRSRELPVVLVNATGQPPGRTDLSRPAGAAASAPPAGAADLVTELDAQPDDILITKVRWGAFYDTPLHDRLAELGVTQVVLVGIATSIGVESTARSAHEYGYNVVLATDAMTDRDLEAHANSVERIFPRLGETATTAEILDKLQS
jgi:nicotinamidase-related amidase